MNLITATLTMLLSVGPRAELREERTYLETDGKKKATIRFLREERPDGVSIQITSEQPGSKIHQEFQLDRSGQTTQWRFVSEADGSDVTAERQERRIRLKGTRSGKPVDKTFDLDQHPWNQPFEFGIESHLRTGTTEQTVFWAIGTEGPGDMGCARFRAQFRHRLAPGAGPAGEELSAWRITFTSWLSVFWWGEYLYSTDGRLRRSEDKGGRRVERCLDLARCGN